MKGVETCFINQKIQKIQNFPIFKILEKKLMLKRHSKLVTFMKKTLYSLILYIIRQLSMFFFFLSFDFLRSDFFKNIFLNFHTIFIFAQLLFNIFCLVIDSRTINMSLESFLIWQLPKMYKKASLKQ